MFKRFKVVSMVTLISYKHTIARFVSHMFILLRMSGGVERRRAVCEAAGSARVGLERVACRTVKHNRKKLDSLITNATTQSWSSLMQTSLSNLL